MLEEVKKINWHTKDKKAKNVTHIIKGVGKKFLDNEMRILKKYFDSLEDINSVYIKNGYLEIYYDYMAIYPDKNMLIRDGFL